MRKALYYPYISIPRDSWLTQSLLYWDSLGCIVPYSYISNPYRFQPHMRDCIKEGLIEQIMPANYTYSIRNFKEGFLEILENEYFLSISRKIEEGVSFDYKQIHFEKLGSLGRELVDRGLAFKGKDEWFLVEEETANTFMIYLSTLIGVVSDYDPITRRKYNFSQKAKLSKRRLSLLKSASDGDTSVKEMYLNIDRTYKLIDRGYSREYVLDNLLPVPDGKICAYELLKFKEKNGEALNNFREYIENFLYEYDTVDKNLKQDKMNDFLYNSKLRQEELERKMKEHGWFRVDKFDIGSLIIESSLLIDGLAGKSATEIKLSITGIMISACKLIYENHKEYKNILEKPLSYSISAKSLFRKNGV